ncbi:MAG: hypothetical protein V4733_00285 [Verrucomicrobiota bacterium]
MALLNHFVLPLVLGASLLPAAAQILSDAGNNGDFKLTDLSAGRPWLPPMPEKITPEMEKQMEAFTKIFGFQPVYPRSKGISEKNLTAAGKLLADYGLHRDASGKVVADKVILWNGEWGLPKGVPPGALNFMDTIMPLIGNLNGLYSRSVPNTPAHDQAVEYVRIVLEYFATRTWNATQPKSLWVSKGYALRDLRPVFQFTSTAHLIEDPAMRAQLAENAWWMLDGSMALDKSPAWSTDALLNTVPQAFGGVAALPNGPAKYQRILALRRALDSSVIGNPYNLVTPDGGIIHHTGVHDHYAHYSFGPLVRMYTALEQAGFPSKDSAEITRRMKLAAKVWAWATMGWSVAPNLSQRIYLPPADSKKPNITGRGDFAMAAAALEEATGGPKLGENRELAGLVLTVQPSNPKPEVIEAWKKNGFEAKPISGNISLPSDGAVIHRRPGWMVVLRGQPRFLRGGEGHGSGFRYARWGSANTFAGRFCDGSIFIGDSGEPLNPADSGWVEEGFDYCRVPGNTGTDLPEDKMVGGYFGTNATLGGGCSLDGQGIWIFNGGGNQKSCFMVDDRITFVATGIEPSKTLLTTTIFQAAEARALPLFVDDKPAPESGAWDFSGTTAHTILDGRARGYYIHPGGDSLRLTRGNQEWTYCMAKYFNPEADPQIGVSGSGGSTKVFNKTTPKQPIEGPPKLKYFKPSVHRYSTLGFQHGDATKPGQRHAFTLLMKSDRAKLQEFAKAMGGSTPPVKSTATETAHTFVDTATGLRGTALFVAGEVPANQIVGAVKNVSRPCCFIEKPGKEQFSLAIESSDTSDTKPFVIEIKGTWKLKTRLNDVKVTAGAATTTVTVPYHDMQGRVLRFTARP